MISIINNFPCNPPHLPPSGCHHLRSNTLYHHHHHQHCDVTKVTVHSSWRAPSSRVENEQTNERAPDFLSFRPAAIVCVFLCACVVQFEMLQTAIGNSSWEVRNCCRRMQSERALKSLSSLEEEKWMNCSWFLVAPTLIFDESIRYANLLWKCWFLAQGCNCNHFPLLPFTSCNGHPLSFGDIISAYERHWDFINF